MTQDFQHRRLPTAATHGESAAAVTPGQSAAATAWNYRSRQRSSSNKREANFPWRDRGNNCQLGAGSRFII